MNPCDHSCKRRRATPRNPYHFVDSGLPNVYLIGIEYLTCSKCGLQSAEIPAVKRLMEVLARAVVKNDAPLTGPEIRFLRKRLGEKSADFASSMGVTLEEVSRWENAHHAPGKSADKLIRIYYCLQSRDAALREVANEHLKEWLATIPIENPQEEAIRATLTGKEKWHAELCPAY